MKKARITVIKHREELISQWSPRQLRIMVNKQLGLDASRYEAMTDADYESLADFLAEKAERLRNDYRKR